MKNQYFGDINDYRKYGLLRCFAESGLRLGVCWMLTPDDGRNDGQKTEYLAQPDRWRHYDNRLFDAIAAAMTGRGLRGIRAIEEAGLFEGAAFHSETLGDKQAEREVYFAAARDALSQADLIFFDPDIGIEVASANAGERGSSRYLFWPELEDAWRRGNSLLVYQHYPREQRDEFTARLAQSLQGRTEGASVVTIGGANVLFLLAGQTAHEERINTALEQLESQWAGQFSVIRIPAVTIETPSPDTPLMAEPALPHTERLMSLTSEASTAQPKAGEVNEAQPAPAAPVLVTPPEVPAAPSALSAVSATPTAPFSPSATPTRTPELAERYHVNIFWSDADACFVADIPDLPNCSAVGQTQEEALAQLKLIRDAWFRSAHALARPIPTPTYRPSIYR